MSDTRQHVHDLVDQLDAGQLAAVGQLLEVMTDPVARSLANAPVDDEPITPEEAAAIDAGIASLERDGGVPMEEVLADFGLTVEDFRKMAETDSPESR